MYESIDPYLFAIGQDNIKDISFCQQAYPDIYNLVVTTPIQNIMSYLENHVVGHFQEFIIECNKNQSISTFKRFSIIFNEYIRYKYFFHLFFSIIERYTTDNFSLNQRIDQIFIRTFHSLVNYDELLFSFFEQFDEFHFTDFKSNPEFNDLVGVSKLIHFCYKDKENCEILTEHLLKETEKSSQNFIQKIIESDPIEFINSSNRYINTERSLLKSLFFTKNAKLSLSNVYNSFISASDSLFERIKGQIKESCKCRDKSFIIEYYKFISFRKPTENHLTSLSESIHDQIKTESIENIIELGNTISFYNELFESINNSFLTRKYNRQMIEFVNSEKKKIFKNLMSFISLQANSKPDISPIRPILAKIESKNEFELIYTRHAISRIVPPTEKQIEKENSIISQIQPTSFEFSNLLKILKEASQSIELNLGPVLMCHSTIWPFKPPFPQCSYFDTICNDIKEKYKKLNPGRFVTFPFDSWNVVVKDTFNNFFISGNAVQAQVFLHLNNHDIVHKDSFAPAVTSAQLTSVLKSLSSKKVPLLIENQSKNEITFFKLNRNFKNKSKVLKLPIPASVYKTVQKDVVQAKNDQIDATIAKMMKEKRVMKYIEFESAVIEKMSNRCRVLPDEVKNRVNELIAREFIQMNDEDNSIVYLP